MDGWMDGWTGKWTDGWNYIYKDSRAFEITEILSVVEDDVFLLSAKKHSETTDLLQYLLKMMCFYWAPRNIQRPQTSANTFSHEH